MPKKKELTEEEKLWLQYTNHMQNIKCVLEVSREGDYNILFLFPERKNNYVQVCRTMIKEYRKGLEYWENELERLK